MNIRPSADTPRRARRGLAVPVLTVCALLATSAAAIGATNTLTGKFGRNDANSKVTVKVETSKKGVPTRIASFNISGATMECYDEAENRLTPGADVSAKLGSFKIKPLKLAGQKTRYLFSGSKTINGVKHDISGDVTAKGNALSGSVRSKPTPKCSIPENTFTAKKK